MKYVRERILEPILIPLAAMAVIAFGALNLSRLFLASASAGRAVIVASAVAIAILAGAAWATSRDRIDRGLLLGGVALVALVLGGAGLLADEVDRDAHEAHAEDGTTEEFASEITITAVDIDFPEKQLEAADGGGIKINYQNEGDALHTLVFEGLEDDFKLEATGGTTDSGIVVLDPADYVFYCDIPGHRAAGMEGALTVTEGGGDGGTAGGAGVEVTAVDIDFPETEFEAAAGEVPFTYVNEGNAFHTLVVEGFEDEMKIETAGGETGEGSLTLGPGTYTLYCDVPGHRAAGMEGQLRVT